MGPIKLSQDASVLGPARYVSAEKIVAGDERRWGDLIVGNLCAVVEQVLMDFGGLFFHEEVGLVECRESLEVAACEQGFDIGEFEGFPLVDSREMGQQPRDGFCFRVAAGEIPAGGFG